MRKNYIGGRRLEIPIFLKKSSEDLCCARG
jgi:hypothetical protein